jgi:hypothetical protein
MTLVSLLRIIVCLLLLPNSAQHREVLSYEPANVELQGKLTLQWKYGPPNYGENPDTDEKFQVPILILDKAVDVRGDPNSDVNAETVHAAKQVQLAFTKTEYRHFVGKNVDVQGTLFRAHTGHHYTDVVMNVAKINQSHKRR